jgi:hypothetical protein
MDFQELGNRTDLASPILYRNESNSTEVRYTSLIELDSYVLSGIHGTAGDETIDEQYSVKQFICGIHLYFVK